MVAIETGQRNCPPVNIITSEAGKKGGKEGEREGCYCFCLGSLICFELLGGNMPWCGNQGRGQLRFVMIIGGCVYQQLH